MDIHQRQTPEIERHPLRPFMPENAQLLMLGSFPPPKERWCMDFFYPNPQNDMWRIMGQIFFGDKTHFEEQGDLMKVPRDQVQSTKAGRKVFNREEIISFCETKGIAIFDTAQAVIRLQGNAADEHLEIVEQTDIAALLQQIPLCHNICCTGGKAAQTLAETLHCAMPKVGEFIEAIFQVVDDNSLIEIMVYVLEVIVCHNSFLQSLFLDSFIFQLLTVKSYIIPGFIRCPQTPLQKALHKLSLKHNSCFHALAFHLRYLNTARDKKPPDSFSENSGDKMSLSTRSFNSC